MPDKDEQQKQVEANYEAFQKRLPDLLGSYRGKFALMRDREIIEFFDTARDAYIAGLLVYENEMFSLQEVNDEPVNLGWYSYVVGPR